MDMRDPHAGRFFSLFYTFDRAHSDAIVAYANDFHFTNPLNPLLYPELVEMENELIRFSKTLMNAPGDSEGTFTSGGTESIALALRTYRDLHAERTGADGARGAVILAESAHPAFRKAAEWLGLDVIRIPLDPDFRMNVETTARILREHADPGSRRIVALVGSAPQFAQGVIDDIGALARLGTEFDVPVHVDACLGGFVFPFWESASQDGTGLPTFDFRLPGVTSISLDLHKYGFALKGASVLLRRHSADRARSLFVDCEWNGSPLATTGFLGSRSGAPLAAAWKSVRLLRGTSGTNSGFRDGARRMNEVAERFRAGIQASSLEIVGDPLGPILSIRHRGGKNRELLAYLRERRWIVDWVRDPESVHFSFSPIHLSTIDALVADLRAFGAELNEGDQADRTGAEVASPLAVRATRATGAALPSAYFDAPGDFIRAGYAGLYSTADSTADSGAASIADPTAHAVPHSVTQNSEASA